MLTFNRFCKTGSFICITLLGMNACKHSSNAPADIKAEMRDSYAASYALFRDVWSPDRFGDPQNRADVISLIDRLSKNFHGVEDKTQNSKYDSGFALALQLNQEFLIDARRRLKQGYVDYAAWRLRGVMHNCVACHTRYQAPVRFVGEAPAPASETAADKLEVADFLVATRQFEKASDLLLKITSSPGGMTSSEQPEFRALKLWLVVQMRAAPSFALMGAKLKELSALGHFRAEAATIVDQWIHDLKRFGNEPKLKGTIEDARSLTSSLSTESNFTHDDQFLVSTLYATNILHNLLPSSKDESRREAIYLLGLAYHHIQIQELEIFRGLYLEQCIKEFPHTLEARKAFELFQDEIEFLSSGSSGVQMEEEDKAKVESLRALAY